MLAALLMIFEYIFIAVAHRLRILSIPTQRSSHSKPTVNGGGIIVPLAVLSLALIGEVSSPFFFIGLALVSLVSFVNDIHPLPNSPRLITHFAALALLVLQMGVPPLSIAAVAAMIVGVGIINAFNFMDGINGITPLYSIVVAATLSWLDISLGFMPNEILGTLIVALMVFCWFNVRTNALCFAGDVGAIAIGYILVFAVFKLILHTGEPGYIVLLAVYGVDSVLTIIRRIILRENIFKAHRRHLYQILSNEMHNHHLVVAASYAILQLAISAGALLLPVQWLTVYCLAVIAILVIAYFAILRYATK